MKTNLQVINITQARNNLFDLVTQTYLSNQGFVIQKSGIPMVSVNPIAKNQTGKKKPKLSKKQKEQLELVDKLRQFHNSMSDTGDSVRLIKKMRSHGH